MRFESDEDAEGVQTGPPSVTEGTRVEFHYYVKGTLGKKNRCLAIEFESETIRFSDATQLPVSAIVNTSKIANTPGYK